MGSGGSKLTPEAASAATKAAAASAFRSEPGVVTADSPRVQKPVVKVNGQETTLGDVLILTSPLVNVEATAELLLENTVKRAWGMALYHFQPDVKALKKLSPKQDWSSLMSMSKEWVVMTNAKMSLDATEAVAKGNFTPSADFKPASVKLKFESPKPLPKGSYALVVAYLPEDGFPDDIFKTVRTPPVAVRLIHVL